MMQAFYFTSFEKRIVLTLSSVFFCRMVGLFLPLPIVAVAIVDIEGFSPLLLGLVLGIHGLTQALMQVPLGLLSDRYGRRQLIIAGLVVFVFGSWLAVVSETVNGLICARALQGAGAVASVMMACATDYVRPTAHAKAMALIGLGIGSAFIFSLPIAPILIAAWGLDGIFMTAVVLGGVAIVIVLVGLPTESDSVRQQRLPLLTTHRLQDVFLHPGLLHLNAGIFVLHFILAANFVVLPHAITMLTGLSLGLHWQFYAPVLLLSFALMLPYLAYAEQRKKTKPFLLLTIVVLALSQIFLALLFLIPATGNLMMWLFIFCLLIFFFAFNYIEATIPALISCYSPVGRKGVAMGFLSSAQFLGVFTGALSMAWVVAASGTSALYLATAVVAASWVVVALAMPQPPQLADFMFRTKIGSALETQRLTQRLTRMPGVVDVLVDDKNDIVYLKIYRSSFDSEQLLNLQRE